MILIITVHVAFTKQQQQKKPSSNDFSLGLGLSLVCETRSQTFE